MKKLKEIIKLCINNIQHLVLDLSWNNLSGSIDNLRHLGDGLKYIPNL